MRLYWESEVVNIAANKRQKVPGITAQHTEASALIVRGNYALKPILQKFSWAKTSEFCLRVHTSINYKEYPTEKLENKSCADTQFNCSN